MAKCKMYGQFAPDPSHRKQEDRRWQKKKAQVVPHGRRKK